MKSLILVLTMSVAAFAFAPTDADAKRLGGGGSSGMQRSLPSRSAPDAAPAKPATPTSPTAAPVAPGANPAVAAPKRSWMGPIAGLAAGLGLAALMSHFGMGAGMGNLVTMLLLAGLAFFAIRFVMRRFAASSGNGMQYAGAGNSSSMAPSMASSPAPAGPAWNPSSASLALPAGTTAVVPSGFDKPGFERIAKMIFIRMQTANDTADLNDLRAFTTPDMYAAIKMDLQDRHSAAQQTDVVRIDAEVLEVASEADRQLVSVRFHGLIREEKDGAASDFDEVWHLVKPLDGSREWAIAGIQQTA